MPMDARDIESLIREALPDARIEIFVSEGELLSDAMQDGKSFRYALVNVGANSGAELDAKLDACKKLLDFRFATP